MKNILGQDVQPGFQNTEPLLVRTADGHNCVPQEPLVVVTEAGHTYRAPVGSTTDGLSTPQAIWNLIPPFGVFWYSGIIHDAAFRDTLEILCADGTWAKCHLTLEAANELIHECMASQCRSRLDELQREVIYKSLERWSQASFDEDRNK